METTPRNKNMQEIITKFNISLSEEDLFLAWQNELRLRQQIRTTAGREVFLIESNDEFKFLQRCLYYGPRQDLFFEILYRNMANITILNCVLQAPPALIRGFLKFLARNILEQKPPARDLQFLINIYREEFRADFEQLINNMDSGLCAHLLARTSNNDLHQLLKHRQFNIPREDQPEYYGLINPSYASNEYPTIYGDKIQIIASAVKALKASQSFNLSATPLNRESIEALLDGTDMLFRAGLLSDCLAILTRMVNAPGIDDQSLLLSNEEPYYQQIDGLLRKVLPIYSLLLSPAAPHRYALELYRSLFPGFRPDPASLLYLDIHSIVIASLQGHHQYTHYELAQKGGKIMAFRPDDTVASTLLKSENKMVPEDLSGLEQAIKQRIPYQPHEVYVIMEVLRLWEREGRISFNRISAANLLNGYLQFFNWIPAAPFMNEQVQSQLGPIADEETRTACERILTIIQDSSRIDLVNHRMPTSKFSDHEVHKLRQQLLLSKYMGVF